MNSRTIIIICLIFVACMLSGLFLIGLLAFQFLRPAAVSMPPELEQPSIVSGKDFLEKKEFSTNAVTGKVTDIVYLTDPEPEIAVAGDRGSVRLSPKGDVKSSLSFDSRPTHVDFIDVDADGTFEFLNRGGEGWQDASLIDHSGQTLWTYGGSPAVDDMDAADTDGDGIAEFVVGHNGSGGVHLLDKSGRLLWKQSDGNVWHVEFVDTDGDGVVEIVHSNAGGEITVRDTKGTIVKQTKPAAYFSDFSLCRWPTKKSSELLLLAEKDIIWLFDFGGKTVAQFDAPGCGKLGHARGTLVRFAEEQPEFLAVVVEIQNWQRSVLYVYRQDKTLVYQEVLDDQCSSIATIPAGEAEETLLLGGTGRIWKYSLAKPGGNEQQ
ncbi:hypothetical protein Pan153_11240 [Gimesia panareensis]|uniref:FG-GAP repeat protein n=1 Tax=Gimesia panareensis TaxID=2527978 RepID=A0A518FJG8_9PLAN|nr:VCBS repeat-containing protein [Gimesia panareensis]QDV16494.1 hypothetical protein Pan153_11240 [Gimesia panareensis]